MKWKRETETEVERETVVTAECKIKKDRHRYYEGFFELYSAATSTLPRKNNMKLDDEGSLQ